jgi:hypothetical protein
LSVGVIVAGVVIARHRSASQIGFGFDFNRAPTAKTWDPDPGAYCSMTTSGGSLVGAPAFAIASVANAAPTAAAHTAALALYQATINNQPTALAYLALKASYTCPAN